jgi:hypothetical protein
VFSASQPYVAAGSGVATNTLSKSARQGPATVDRVCDLGRVSLTMRAERFRT